MISLFRNFIGFREYPKYFWVKRYALYKQALMRAADQLAAAGVIRESSDVFYLFFDEFRQAIKTKRVDQSLVEQWREQYARYAMLTPPRIILSDGEVLLGKYSTSIPQGALPGVAVSAGIVQGFIVSPLSSLKELGGMVENIEIMQMGGMAMKRDFALVLAGGGGKGAYQIGAWQALKEFGLDKRIGAVAGTSVGALNGALFAQGDFDTALKAWQSVDNDRILQIEKSRYLDALKKFQLSRVFTDGIFSSQGLTAMIENYGNLEKVNRSPVTLIATCCRITDFSLRDFKLPELKARYFRLNDMPPEKISAVLLASSAIPLVFDSILIDGDRYVDGGLVDNVPILPVYNLGYRKIIVINLDMYFRLPREKYRDADIIEVAPEHSRSETLSSILDFNPDSICSHIQQGYKDTSQVLSARFKLPLLRRVVARLSSKQKNSAMADM